MAFAADVKGELCRAQAEAYGILLFCGAFHPRQARIVTECGALKERLPVLFRKAFKLSFDQLPQPGEGKGTFLIEDPAKLKTIFDAFDLPRCPCTSTWPCWRRSTAAPLFSGGRFWRGAR